MAIVWNVSVSCWHSFLSSSLAKIHLKRTKRKTRYSFWKEEVFIQCIPNKYCHAPPLTAAGFNPYGFNDTYSGRNYKGTPNYITETGWVFCKFWYPMDFRWSSLPIPIILLSSPLHYCSILAIPKIEFSPNSFLTKRTRRHSRKKVGYMKSLLLLNFSCLLPYFY